MTDSRESTPRRRRSGPWSHAEVERVKRLYGLHSEQEIARRLNRPYASVRRILHEIYDRGERRSGPWSADEVRELRLLLGAAPTEIIARKLRRGPQDVERKVRELQGQIRPRPWTSQEEQELKTLYGSRDTKHLEIIFARPAEQIEAKARELCLAKSKAFLSRVAHERVRMPRWTEEEIDLLARLYPDHDNLEIARRLGRTTKSIVSKAHDLGLKKSPERLRLMGRQNVRRRYDRRRRPRPSGGERESEA